MKIATEKMTIEVSSEELRQSNSLSESFTLLLRSCFNGVDVGCPEEEEVNENE